MHFIVEKKTICDERWNILMWQKKIDVGAADTIQKIKFIGLINVRQISSIEII